MLERGIVGVAVMLSMLPVSRAADAEASPPVPSEEIPEEGAQCAPPCAGGRVCVSRTCVDPCAPGCPPDTVCTRNGHCIPQNPLAESPVSTASSPAPADLSPPTVRLLDKTWTDGGNRPPNMDMYNKFKQRRAAGAGLLVAGCFVIGTAIVLGAVSGATGNEGLLYGAVGVEVFGDTLFFPGLAMMIQGKIGMRKAEAGLYAQRTSSRIHSWPPREGAAVGVRPGGYRVGLTVAF
jgi:hypothetical protein